MGNRKSLIKRLQVPTVFVLIFTLMISAVCNDSVNNSFAAKRMKLQIKTTRYNVKKPLKKPKKNQTIKIKRLPHNYKVIWKSSNKKLVSVKRIRSSKNKANCTVFLSRIKLLPGKKQTVRITAVIKTKKSNKKVKKLTKKITFANPSFIPSNPTMKPPVPSQTPSPPPLPTLHPIPSPTDTGDNLVTLPPKTPLPTPGEVFITLPPDDETTPPEPTKNPKDNGWTDWY